MFLKNKEIKETILISKPIQILNQEFDETDKIVLKINRKKNHMEKKLIK